MNMHPVPRHSNSRLTNPEVLEAFEFAAQADAPNTQRAYLADWKHFIEWCKTRHRCPLPVRPDDLALYLRYCAEKLGLKVSTVQRRVSAISEAHARNGHQSPAGEWVVRNTMRRLRRDLGAPARGKKPVLVDDLKAMLTHCPATLAGLRDKAVLLVGFCGAFRRSDLVNLDVEDLAKADEGLVLMLRKGKTDQKREGRKIGIPYGKDPLTCPVRALCEWIAEAQITSGPLFRAVTKFGRPRPTRLCDRVVAEIVKKYCKQIGKRVPLFSGHSLRAGFATSAAIAGASERSIQKQTGHASVNVLRRYIREAEMFRDNALSKLDL
jgi:integrase